MLLTSYIASPTSTSNHDIVALMLKKLPKSEWTREESAFAKSTPISVLQHAEQTSVANCKYHNSSHYVETQAASLRLHLQRHQHQQQHFN